MVDDDMRRESHFATSAASLRPHEFHARTLAPGLHTSTIVSHDILGAKDSAFPDDAHIGFSLPDI